MSLWRALFILLVCNVAAGQAPLPLATKATYETPSTRETITFGRRSPQVGDQVEQTIEVELALRTTTRQGTKVLERGEQKLTRRQQRVIVADRVEEGRTQAAHVKFLAAERQVGDEAKSSEPVAGKTYHCQRDGDRLIVHTIEGEVPPMEEFRLVLPCMEMLGRAHPLSNYFAGKSVRVGEKIKMPEEIARELLGADDEFGKVGRFEMTLQKRELIEGKECAVFDAEIEATGDGTSQMRMLVTGPIVLEIDSCRAVSADFRGPIGMSEVHGIYGARYQVDSMGKFRVAVTSRYSTYEVR